VFSLAEFLWMEMLKTSLSCMACRRHDPTFLSTSAPQPQDIVKYFLTPSSIGSCKFHRETNPKADQTYSQPLLTASVLSEARLSLSVCAHPHQEGHSSCHADCLLLRKILGVSLQSIIPSAPTFCGGQQFDGRNPLPVQFFNYVCCS
jgi:hypothetical protein